MELINDNTICFKSVPDFFYKERDGLKSNTVRKLDETEKRALNLFIEVCNYKGLEPWIRILLVDAKPKRGSQEYRHEINGFERKLTDISEWEGLYIISWKG